MLADRHYMRDGSYRPPMSMTAKLIITLVVVFALQCIDDVYSRSGVVRYLMLTTAGLQSGYVWQFVTFQFLHGGLLHLFFNALILWWTGRFLESVVGWRRMLFAFIGCGVIGGLLQGILMLVSPNYGTAVYGASGGVSGLFAIFALLQRHQQIYLYAILPVRAGTLLWVSLGIAGFFTLVPAGGNVAHAAHLGGLLAGMAFVKLGWHHDYQTLPWDGFGARIKAILGKQSIIRPVSGTGKPKVVKSTSAKFDDADFIARQVDPILDKISAKGLHSLTEEERTILEKARGKIRR